MIADHDEQHGQGEVSVVCRAHLAAHSRYRVRLASRAYRIHHLALAGDDDEEHVGHHHRADHRAYMHVRGARSEDMEQAPGDEHDEPVDERAKQKRFVAERSAQGVVDEPAEHQGGDAQADRHRGRQRHHGVVDEIRARAEPVNDDEQTEAREPGRVRLPFGPVKIRSQRFAFRSREKLLAAIKAAAVHRPQLAEHAAFRVFMPSRRPQ